MNKVQVSKELNLTVDQELVRGLYLSLSIRKNFMMFEV